MKAGMILINHQSCHANASAEKTILEESSIHCKFCGPTYTELGLLHKANLEHMSGQSF